MYLRCVFLLFSPWRKAVISLCAATILPIGAALCFLDVYSPFWFCFVGGATEQTVELTGIAQIKGGH